MPNNNARQIASNQLAESGRLLDLSRAKSPLLAEAARIIADSQAQGGQLLVFGNGGSAAQAQHISAELVGRFLVERRPLKAVALNCDTSILTAVGNDYGYEEIFSRQVAALAGPEDVVMGISTSGTSPNVIKALGTAKAAGAYTILMCGPQRKILEPAQLIIDTPEAQTPRIQELHLIYSHIICGLVDYFLFPDASQTGC